MAKVNDIPEMTAEDYAALPPLVKKGEDREAKIEEIVTGWCTSKDECDWKDHIEMGGFSLERVALVDENTDEPIDLGELVRRVEKHLREQGAPQEFEEKENLHIILRGCRVDKCSCRGVNIRPHWTCERVAFGHGASFSSATFGREASFHSSTFGGRARFASAKFGDEASFESATFGGRTSFRSATFGNRATFEFATFGEPATFEFATFGARARFASAMFGKYTSFLNTRFGAGGRMEAAGFGRPDRGPLGLRRMRERFSRWFDWTKVRSLGRLQILTRVSYVALVLVPLLAGGWPAVRAAVNWVNDDVRAAAREFDAAADRIENLRTDLPSALTKLDDVLQKTETQIRRVEDELGGRSLEERDLPLGWVLAFFAALFVTLGHLLYQLAVDERVRERSREAFVAARNDEFRQCSEGQRRDLLTRAFPWLRQIADALPGFRAFTLVSRHGHTVWIPPSLEVLNKVSETSQPPEAPASETEIEDPPEEAVEAWRQEEAKRLIKFTRGELELIVVDEGARAEYDVAARERMRWAVVAGVLYSYGVLVIAWLVMLQMERILLQAGLLGDPDAYNLLTPRVFVPLGVGVTVLYVTGGVVWLIVRLVQAAKRRGGK